MSGEMKSLAHVSAPPPTNPPPSKPLSSDSCSCVGVSPLSAPRANKKRKRQLVATATQERTHTHTGDVWAAYGPGERGGYVSVRGV